MNNNIIVSSGFQLHFGCFVFGHHWLHATWLGGLGAWPDYGRVTRAARRRRRWSLVMSCRSFGGCGTKFIYSSLPPNLPPRTAPHPSLCPFSWLPALLLPLIYRDLLVVDFLLLFCSFAGSALLPLAAYNFFFVALFCLIFFCCIFFSNFFSVLLKMLIIANCFGDW